MSRKIRINITIDEENLRYLEDLREQRKRSSFINELITRERGGIEADGE